MPKVIILGSANAVPDEKHDNTHMVVVGAERVILIDCVSNPLARLKQAGVAVEKLTDLVLTHFHPDHVSGVPLLLMDLWLLGRKEPLNVYGLDYTLDRLEKMMELYTWKSWPNFFEVIFHRVPEKPLQVLLEAKDIRLLASPVKHLIPTIGIRAEFPLSGKAFAYSCDTEPTEAVVELASGADVLVHEAAGATKGHSSPEQAGEIARTAEAAALYLIHYPTAEERAQGLVEDAKKTYPGPVALAKDWLELSFEA